MEGISNSKHSELPIYTFFFLFDFNKPLIIKHILVINDQLALCLYVYMELDVALEESL